MLYTTSIFLQLFSILSQFQRFRIFYPYYSFYAFHSFDLLIGFLFVAFFLRQYDPTIISFCVRIEYSA